MGKGGDGEEKIWRGCGNVGVGKCIGRGKGCGQGGGVW